MDLIETGYHEIYADGDPDLGLHGVFGCTVACLDAEVLFDPFEEQFNVPATLIDVGDGYCRQSKVVGDEYEAFTDFSVDEADAPEFFRIIPFTFGTFQSNTLIATQSSGFVDRTSLRAAYKGQVLSFEVVVFTKRLINPHPGSFVAEKRFPIIS